MNVKVYAPKKEDNFKEAFGWLLDDRNLCDITFLIDNHTVQAHKIIFACRSPYWKSMLIESQMHETTKKEFVIADFKYTSFTNLIYFMYTDELKNGTNIDDDFELLAMADMYLMPRLKNLLEHKLISHIDMENLKEFEELTGNIDLPLISSIVKCFNQLI